MLNKEEISRYSRHLLLPEIGTAGQEKLKQAKVLVIGAGGLGCPVLLYLTAAGVGEIGIVDFDKVEESNLQRQILFSVDDIGNEKSKTAAEKLSKQNPFVKFTVHNLQLTNKNALDIIKWYDIVIDGSDNFSTRYLVNDACVLLNKALIHGSIYKFEGQVSVFNYTDPKGGKGPTYRCIFPTPPPPGSVPNCSEIGVIGVLPGIIGTLQAAEAIKIITGIGETLSGKLLLVDVLAMNMTTIDVKRNDDGVNASPKTAEAYLQTDYDLFCENKIPSVGIKTVSTNELIKMLDGKEPMQLLDVRELQEEPKVEALIDLQIPLNEISAKSNLISKQKKVIVFCQSGARSRRAIEILEKDFGFTNLYNLEGGVMNLSPALSPSSKAQDKLGEGESFST